MLRHVIYVSGVPNFNAATPISFVVPPNAGDNFPVELDFPIEVLSDPAQLETAPIVTAGSPLGTPIPIITNATENNPFGFPPTLQTTMATQQSMGFTPMGSPRLPYVGGPIGQTVTYGSSPSSPMGSPRQTLVPRMQGSPRTSITASNNPFSGLPNPPISSPMATQVGRSSEPIDTTVSPVATILTTTASKTLSPGHQMFDGSALAPRTVSQQFLPPLSSGGGLASTMSAQAAGRAILSPRGSSRSPTLGQMTINQGSVTQQIPYGQALQYGEEEGYEEEGYGEEEGYEEGYVSSPGLITSIGQSGQFTGQALAQQFVSGTLSPNTPMPNVVPTQAVIMEAQGQSPRLPSQGIRPGQASLGPVVRTTIPANLTLGSPNFTRSPSGISLSDILRSPKMLSPRGSPEPVRRSPTSGSIASDFPGEEEGEEEMTEERSEEGTPKQLTVYQSLQGSRYGASEETAEEEAGEEKEAMDTSTPVGGLTQDQVVNRLSLVQPGQMMACSLENPVTVRAKELFADEIMSENDLSTIPEDQMATGVNNVWNSMSASDKLYWIQKAKDDLSSSGSQSEQDSYSCTSAVPLSESPTSNNEPAFVEQRASLPRTPSRSIPMKTVPAKATESLSFPRFSAGGQTTTVSEARSPRSMSPSQMFQQYSTGGNQ